MAQITGKATIKVDGRELRTADDATLDPGGVSREDVAGSGKVYGYSESETKAPELECTVYHTADTSLAELAAITDATVIFETDTGVGFVLTGAWVKEPPKLKAKGGEIALKFGALTCEEDN